MRYSRITGTGSYLPPRRVTNAELADQLAASGIETSDQWIIERTGIRARHFAAPEVTSSDLGAQAARHAALVTVEEGAIMGGAGSAVCEVLNDAGCTIPVLQLGLPDAFIDHGDQAGLLAQVGLDAAGIEASVRARFADLLQ